MQLSSQVIIVRNHPKEGQHLLYHARTQALVCVEDSLMGLLHDMSSPKMFSLRMEHAESLVQLEEMGFIVENAAKDVQAMHGFMEAMKKEKIGNTLVVTVLTTMACNFKCVYCFEEASREPLSMTQEVALAVMAWIKARVVNMKYTGLFVTFYGGEPLLNEDALEFIARELHAWSTSVGIGFRFMIQTNGYLMTRDRVQKYLPLGLSNVRISLDGLRGRHDQNRPLRGGGGSFGQIMENILAIVHDVKVGISVSYDKNGVGHIAELLDDMDERGILHQLGRFVFSPIHASLGPSGRPEKIRGVECAMNYSDQELFKAGVEINRLLALKKLPVPKGLPASACSLSREFGSFTIDPEGYLFACNAMLGHRALALGNVFESEFYESRAKFLKMDVGVLCPSTCAYLPICNGGCRLMSFLEHGSFERPYCKAAYLDQMAPILIKNEYDAL